MNVAKHLKARTQPILNKSNLSIRSPMIEMLIDLLITNEEDVLSLVRPQVTPQCLG